MPYALVIAGGHVKATGQSPSDFRAAIPPAGANVNPTLLALTVAFKALNNALQGLLLVLGATFKGAASAELISMIGNAPTDTINQAMKLLVSRNLVESSERYGQPYYQLHPITYAFGQSWLKGSNRLEGLQQKVRESALAYARKYSTASTDAHNRLAAEMDNLLATAKWSADHGDREVANALAVALMQAGDFVNTRGYVNELLELRRLAASLTSAFPAYGAATSSSTSTLPAVEAEEDFEDEDEELEADQPIVAATSTNVVIPPVRSSVTLDDEDEDLEELEDEDFDEDFEDEDLEDEEDFEDEDFEDELEDEDEESSEQIPIFTSTPRVSASAPPDVLPPMDDEDEEELEVIEDSALLPPVDLDELSRLRNDLVQAKQGGDRRRQSDLLGQMAKLMRERGMLSEAIQTYTEALNAEEAVDDQAGMLNTLGALAELTLKNENLSAAAMYAQRGANIAEKRSDDAGQIRLLTLLGDARQQLGESGDAVRSYQQALDVARTTDDSQNEAVLLFKLGYAYLDDSSPQDAIDVWEEGLALFRKQNRRDYEGRVLGGLGAAYGELERWTEAINFHMSALYIAREVKDKEEELLQLSNLGYASVQAHQLGQAVLRYRQALHVAYTTDDRENIVGTTVDLARLLVESPRHISIAELLVDSALALEPTNRDLKRLKERIEDEQEALEGETSGQASVAGTARDYAANAYSLLDQ
jgi:tetratricopeptide (TPR) repeat protein